MAQQSNTDVAHQIGRRSSTVKQHISTDCTYNRCVASSRCSPNSALDSPNCAPRVMDASTTTECHSSAGTELMRPLPTERRQYSQNKDMCVAYCILEANYLPLHDAGTALCVGRGYSAQGGETGIALISPTKTPTTTWR